MEEIGEMVKREYDLERRTLIFAKSVLKLCKKLPQGVSFNGCREQPII